MSWRTTGILFVVLLVVSGLIVWQSGRGEEDAQTATPTIAPPSTPAGPILEGVTIDDVQRLDVARDGESASFTREANGDWARTAPTATQVVSQTMASRVTGLLSLTSRRTLPSGENPPAAYGLENPAGRITVAAIQEGQTRLHVLLVGNETPAGDAYYVQKQGDPRVHLVTSLTIDNLLNLIDEPPLPPTPVPPLTSTVPLTGATPLTTTIPITEP